MIRKWYSTPEPEPKIDTYEVTGSQEKKIAYLGHLLLTLTPEELSNEFAEPMPEQQLPDKWV